MEAGHPDHGAANPRRCAACKYLRRRCAPDCVLAPYFPASHPRRYADVHAIFGTSNVTRVLQSLPVQERGRAADTMATEAHWRVQDPVYGCAGIIDRLQEEIRAVQRELASTRAQLAVMHMSGTATQLSAPRQGAQPLSPLPPPPLVAAAHAATVHTGGRHRVAVHHQEDEEAPLMDPDEFLDLDGRL
ncbi:LOB domain-containing protein 24-like [Phragmites australis]|uniref:LOB domain-containing protein 24-like n=1 Tax=Phragmites australis TaxID=29695 RepID=UPI002D797CB5|nr:LOB domain-containing protein 24-like [Phragmites australis]